MPRPKSTQRRILGPYRDGGEWRIVVIDPFDTDTPRRDLTFASEQAKNDAQKEIEEGWSRLESVTISTAIDRYREYLQRKGNKTAADPDEEPETIRRLRLFFPSGRIVSEMKPEECSGFYDAFTKRTKPNGKTISVDYHRNTLAEAKSFLSWCVKPQGWLRSNPLAEVKGIGKRKKGKKQLTRDESIKFDAAAQTMTDKGDLGALGAWICLLMGFRQSEVWKRRVRDVDGNGTLLNIEDAKTEAGNRTVEIPEVLQPYLIALSKDRSPLEPLFKAPDGFHTKSWLRAAVKRVCAKAGVPEVSPHGLRGTFVSLSRPAGSSAHAVAATIGHVGTRTMMESYADAGAVRSAAQEQAIKAIGRASNRCGFVAETSEAETMNRKTE